MNKMHNNINPQHINSLMDMINHSPYFKLLGMSVTEMDIGYSKVVIDLEKGHQNHFGVIHGGVYASLIDAATYLSVYCQLDENVGLTTVDLSVNNLYPISKGKLIVEGKSIKIGRTICLAEAYIKDTNNKLIAHGTSKVMVLSDKQSVNHAVKAMGYDKLPEKFLNVSE